jgi:aldehyde:ferredoxin oxidoreductase
LGQYLVQKNVKAVAVKGTKNPPIYDIETLKEEVKKYSSQLHEGSKESFTKYGTPLLTTICEEVGDLPVKYWNGDVWEDGAKSLGIPKYTEELNDKSWPCFACPIGCHRHIKYQDKNGISHEGAGPEYESIGLLGSACLIDDIKAIAAANDLCNRYGVDTISIGSYAAFTMECYEKGLITKEDLNGIEANFGDSSFLMEMISQISEKRGFGARFYKGIRPAAKSIGPEAEELTVEVKNLDFPAHDPRSYFSLSVNTQQVQGVHVI